ncbi:hypothetical protein, partial [Escherichia coli]|uniref:hypothetical protein n=1 Tax=Escherichia coli TaxID=562 RepID=UPI0028E064E1
MLNLAVMTFATVVALMFAVDAIRAWHRNRADDRPSHPVSIWRWAGFCFAMGIVLTRGSDAIVL